MMSGFSILIPSWNNLPYLQACIRSIRKYSSYDHEIVVHVNEGKDGTADWLQQEGIRFTHTANNEGICKAFNQSLAISTHDQVLYLNDDMFVLPEWDTNLRKAIPDAPHWMLSATMIEPVATGNTVVRVIDYGQNLIQFKEELLVMEMDRLVAADWTGSTWPPVLVSRNTLTQVGGLDEAYTPGMYSDPDLAMKIWQLGGRYFKGVGNSLVYHFQAKSTGRVKKNNGRLTFMKKWGITPSAFYEHYLHMGEPWTGPQQEPASSKLLGNRMRVKLQTIGR